MRRRMVVVVVTLIASGYLHIPDALLALYVAAPVELALAPLLPALPARRVAPVAAQQVAPVNTLRRLKKQNIIIFCRYLKF